MKNMWNRFRKIKSLSGGSDTNQLTDDESPILKIDEDLRLRMDLALNNSDIDRVMKLIKLGANLNQARVSDGMTPLFIAIDKERLDLVEKLITLGADLNQTKADGETPFHFVCRLHDKDGRIGVVKIAFQLANHGAESKPIKHDDSLEIQMGRAMRKGDCDKIIELINRGANVNYCDNFHSPIHVAVQNNRLDLLRILIEKKVDVNQENSGETPIFIAAKMGYLGIVKELIKAKADVNKAKNGSLEIITPLCIVTRWRADFHIAQELLAAGADVNKAAQGGITPLYESLRYLKSSTPKQNRQERIKLAAMFLLYGADTTSIDQSDNAGLKANLQKAKNLAQDAISEFAPDKQMSSFLLSKHERVGKDSPAKDLVDDVIGVIFNYVTEGRKLDAEGKQNIPRDVQRAVVEKLSKNNEKVHK